MFDPCSGRAAGEHGVRSDGPITKRKRCPWDALKLPWEEPVALPLGEEAIGFLGEGGGMFLPMLANDHNHPEGEAA
ncbi:MAG TPA: hypothetical protein DCZ69_02090 [Syntrophobacteraceae bacterium]|nr:hypothetical protein [Syntrophobacteraceae bacterium]